MKNPRIFALIPVVALVVFLATGCGSSSSSNNPVSQPLNAAATAAANENGSVGTVTIKITDQGFSPSSVTVKAGQAITFVNATSHSVEPSSDPHPQHTDNPELNAQVIQGGASFTTQPLSKTGTFGIHDHLDPSMTGKVIVQ